MPLLRPALERYVELEPFRHGRATDNETIGRKIVQTALNLGHVESKILRGRPDVIHVNSAFDARSILRDAPLAVLARRHGIPLFLQVHGSFPEVIRPTRKPIEFTKRVLIRNISVLGVLSPVEKSEFEQFLPELSGRICVIKNAISDELLNVKRNESEEPLVLFVSRFLKQKGPFQLLDAVPSILKRIPNVRFAFLGDGPDAPAFDREVSDRQLSAVVQRVPHVRREEIASWYARSWVFVFPTMFPEGMPMVIAEALATGTPIVMTRIRFGLSYMTENENCLYCERDDFVSLAQQVIGILTDGTLRQRMTQANRQLALQFRDDTVAREFVQVYQTLANDARQTRRAFELSQTSFDGPEH